MSVWDGKVVEFTYENWRGVTEIRRVVPIRIWHGDTQYHPKRQWFLHGWCLERQEARDFAFESISGWAEAEDQSLPWRADEPRPSVPQTGPFYGTAMKSAPIDFPDLGGKDPTTVEIIRGGTYIVTAEQARKYDKEFRRLGITTIIREPEEKKT